MRTLSLMLLKEARFGTHAGDTLILVAVAIGDLERKSMTANKLSMFVGLARPTAIRRLRRLQADGLVLRGEDGRYSLTPRALRRVARLA
ncbi:hypothetical protein [Ralstonia pseudosolanacearum]|uniref:hypothetical protein n=1 Tax=Ralstonia pseudosolanacearum TaxID=1310165 RepID=UPI003CF5DE21